MTAETSKAGDVNQNSYKASDVNLQPDILNSESMDCKYCGSPSCDTACTSGTHPLSLPDDERLKSLLPSCALSVDDLKKRKAALQSLSEKINEVRELETGYDLVFTESKEYSKKLLEFINFEQSCCASFWFALVFEPNEAATHLQIFGSPAIKQELATGFKELGVIK